MDPVELPAAIAMRQIMFKAMQEHAVKHQIKQKPQVGNSATHPEWMHILLGYITAVLGLISYLFGPHKVGW